MVNLSPPSSLDAHLGYWLRFVSNHVSMRFRKLLEAENISLTEWVALRTLWEQPESGHAALIEALNMTKSAASKIMNRLEDKGYAERKNVSGKMREQALVLTASGMALVPKLSAIADANDAYFFDHLDVSERELLLHTMQALVKHHQLKDIPTT